MTTSTLKISSSLRLSNKLIAAAGFTAGQRVDANVISPGVIELRLHGTPATPSPDFHIAADRLDHAIARAEAKPGQLSEAAGFHSPFLLGCTEPPPRPHRKTPPPREFKVVTLRDCGTESPIVDNPEPMVRYYREHICSDRYYEPQIENFHVICLNVRRRVIGHKLISHGTLDTILVHPREVFRNAYAVASAAIILIHNHPSGDPTPSEADIKVTRDLIRAGQLLKIDVLDHIIIGRATLERPKEYASLRELGYFYS